MLLLTQETQLPHQRGTLFIIRRVEAGYPNESMTNITEYIKSSVNVLSGDASDINCIQAHRMMS